jgi:N-acetylmuramoyl-L-alanine amidase
MNKIRVGFDLGHGKDTYPPSKGIGDFAEWEFNNAVVKYAIPLAEYNNFEVLLTQPLDSNVVDLNQRIKNINEEHKKNPIKLLMSFHADYNDNINAKGHWCFYWHTSTDGKRLATIWMKYADEILPNPSRGLMQSKPNEWTNFAINRDTLMPTALMEHAFYSNKEDLQLLKSDEFRKQCAIVAVKTICEYFGVEYKEMKTEVKQETKQGKILVSLNIRQSNSTTSTIVGKLNINDMVTILEEQSGWYRIDKGWIFGNSGKYVEIVEKPKEETKIETPVKSEVQYPTLQKGSTGVFVLELQKKLQSLGYILIADGIFSSGTFTVVKNFQTDNGLVADGVFGAKSWNALKIAKPKNVNIEIPKESVTEKKYKYYKESLTHVVEIDPMELRISVEDVAAHKFKANNYVTSGFITWEAMYDKNGKKLNTFRGVPLGILVSEGRVLSNRQPHRVSAGTLIIYKNGKVECKPILDIVKETNINDVWFAVSGCSILPQIRMKQEGFKVYDNYFGLGYRDFSDIGRTTLRPVIGFNPTKNKIVIAVRPDSDIARGQLTLKSMGCSIGLTLDAGGSTVLKVDGKILVNSTRQLYSVISW